MDKMVAEIAGGKRAAQLAAEGITPESFFAASTLGFDAYRGVEVQLTDTRARRRARHRRQRPPRRRHQRRARARVVLVAFLLASWVAAR